MPFKGLLKALPFKASTGPLKVIQLRGERVAASLGSLQEPKPMTLTTRGQPEATPIGTNLNLALGLVGSDS